MDIKDMKYNYENISLKLHTLIEFIFNNFKEVNENYLLLKNLSIAIHPIFCNRMGFTREEFKRLNLGYDYIVISNFKNCPLNNKYPR
jgi:hypothetical protein